MSCSHPRRNLVEGLEKRSHRRWPSTRSSSAVHEVEVSAIGQRR
jgi:hypothetical protein